MVLPAAGGFHFELSKDVWASLVFFFFKEKFNIILFNFSMENCVGIDRNCVESVRLLSVGWPFSQPHSYKECSV